VRSRVQQLPGDVNARLAAGANVFGYEPCAEIIYVEAPDEAAGFELIQVFIEISRVIKAPFYRMDNITKPLPEEVA
jgi:hypothetical protein